MGARCEQCVFAESAPARARARARWLALADAFVAPVCAIALSRYRPDGTKLPLVEQWLGSLQGNYPAFRTGLIALVAKWQ